ncbi:MAG TPA: hypothetical protein VK112_01250 [Fodinibius sp.]|nr:hypothetical protein [Fodinibius sp.]
MRTAFPSKVIIPILIGIGLLWIPLLGDFHIESAVLASLVGCFWAGWASCQFPPEKGDFRAALTILGYLYMAGLPLLTASLFTGCFSVHGLGYWLIFPLPSVFFGYAVGRLLRKWDIRWNRPITFAILLLIAVGLLLFEFFGYPQVYFLNHVWGGWPGPIYDEAVTLSSSALFFRTITLLWAVLLWHIPSLNHQRIALWIVILTAVALSFCYTQLAEMGVISPPEHIQTVLGGSKSTTHFNIYYDEASFSEKEIGLIAREHEFYLRQVTERLELELPDSNHKIASYLYAHPWQKKKLVGAKFTSYVPIWLSQDQLHIARQQLSSSLKHELVHIVAKRFGNRLFNGSWSIGLIEGLAVAIDGGSSPTTTIDQAVASEKPYPNTEELRQAFSFSGFYGGRSGVNYTTSGSFVRYLLHQYPVDDFKQAYRRSSVTAAYNPGWQKLAGGWYRHLDSVKSDSVDEQVAARIFGVPSLFEKTCPHTISHFAEAWDEYQHRLADHDTTRALKALDKALAASDSLPAIKAEWSYRNLMAGNIEEVQQAASLTDTTLDLQLLYADAFMMGSKKGQAKRHLAKAKNLFNREPDTLKQAALHTRINSKQWQIYRRLTYSRQLPDSIAFEQALYRTKIRGVRQAMEAEKWTKKEDYSRRLRPLQLRLQYFNDYLQLIHLLAYRGSFQQAKSWVQKLQQKELRSRYAERLDQEEQWIGYLEAGR